jgi:hypothetical protein
VIYAGDKVSLRCDNAAMSGKQQAIGKHRRKRIPDHIKFV